MNLFKIKEISSYNMICNDSIMNGNIRVDGDIRIDGILNGDIDCNGKIYLGYSGQINGNIICNFIEVQGEIKGNIKSNDICILKSNCKFNGDIITKKISIEPGAIVDMSCEIE